MENEPRQSRPLRVFLCHSSEDKATVHDLYRRLRSDGFEPWLDEENLLPGLGWKDEIAKVMRYADIVIICLSGNSITKRGYVQTEIKLALDAADEQPEGTIFIIPVKLEECEIPARLSRLHWVELYTNDGYQKLVRSLEYRAANLNSSAFSAIDIPPATLAPNWGASGPKQANREGPKESSARAERHLVKIRPDKQGVPQVLVTLPELRDKVYGRDEEIEILDEFLTANEKQHGAIVAPSCFGKTYLLKKFLYQKTQASTVKGDFHYLFEKVIYLDCRTNKTLKSITRFFATLLGEMLEYRVGDEIDFLKHEVFGRVQGEKILLIFDNFEVWIDKNGRYNDNEISVFINTLFNSHHQIRALFVTQKLPNGERNFSRKVKALDGINEKLFGGLGPEAALALVKNEGKGIGLDKVPDGALIEFFEKVYYIPQAIQSMIGYLVEYDHISFSRFQRDFWTTFEEEESSEAGLDSKLIVDDPLRPTRALVKRQILAQDNDAQHLLGLMAFFNYSAPEEVLTVDFSEPSAILEGEKSAGIRAALNRLKNHFLVQTETSAVKEIDDETGEEADDVLYFLHAFISEIVRQVLPAFEKENADKLEAFAEYLKVRVLAAWNKKLYTKQISLAECRLQVEEVLAGAGGQTSRNENLSRALLAKAVALVFSTQTNLPRNSPEAKKNYAVAEKYYRRSLELDPGYAMAYNNLGYLLFKDKSRWREAEECYRKAIELDPKHEFAYNNLGWLLSEDKSRWPEAEENYRKQIELNPTYTDAYNNLGNLLYDYGDRQGEAEENFRKAIQLDPKHDTAYNNLGRLLDEDKNRWPEAEEFYRRALELDPDDAMVYNNLGYLLTKDRNRWPEAEACYRRAIEFDPENVLAYNNLGDLLARDESRRAEAEACYRKTLKLDEDTASAYNRLGILLRQDKSRRSEAEDCYRKAIQHNPAKAAYYYNLGLLLEADENRMGEAEACYRKGIEIEPEDVDYYIKLANLLARDESRWAEAEEIYCKAIQLDPKSSRAHSDLGSLLFRHGKLDASVDAFRTSADLDENDFGPRLNLASLYKILGQKEEAKRYADEALALIEPDDHYNLACLHSILDDKDAALKFLELAIKGAPEYKSMAKDDPDFVWIRDDEKFWEIVGL